MPGKTHDQFERELRRLRDEGRRWLENRDRTIREASEAGMSLRAIGAAVGLTHAGVDKIIKAGQMSQNPVTPHD